jgi:hypothetical protein
VNLDVEIVQGDSLEEERRRYKRKRFLVKLSIKVVVTKFIAN